MNENLKFIFTNCKDVKSCDFYKKLKGLSRKMTGEQLKLYDKDDIIVGFYNNRVISMCCISFSSPEQHFDNEKDKKVPYLYNFICDVSYKKYKNSMYLMNYTKEYIQDLSIIVEDNLEEHDYDQINLDVAYENLHAQKYFEKNDFKFQGDYKQGTKEYKMYTFKF